MRALIFARDHKHFEHFAASFPQKAILDCVFSVNDFLDKFYLYDYDLVFLEFFHPTLDYQGLIAEIKEENQDLSIFCYLDDVKNLNYSNLFSSKINCLLFKTILLTNSSEPNKFSGNLHFNEQAEEFYIKDSLLDLNKKEYLLLKYLFLNQNKYLSKTALSRKIIENCYAINSNIIDVYVYRLRKIIRSKSSDIKIINHRNFGYKITACH